jgi:hypothetical protein
VALPAHSSECERTAGLPADRPPPDEGHVRLFLAGLRSYSPNSTFVGDRLHPALRERLRTAIDEYVLASYEATDDWDWWVSLPLQP